MKNWPKSEFLRGPASVLIATLIVPLSIAVPGHARPGAGIRLELLVQGEAADRALGLVSVPDGSGRLFLLRQRGRLMIIENGAIRPQPFLDLSSKIVCCNKSRGLRSLAFHPDYKSNGFFFVSYTDAGDSADTIVSRFRVSSDPNRARLNSEREILRYSKPETIHHGGLLAFGPDGYLYIGTGDGGSRRLAQDLGSLLGKMLRIDIDGRFPYSIPPDNPFVGIPDALDEIWAYGLRNPWRRTFDRTNGDLYIADVGGASFEEVNFQSGASTGGENYGWPILEGTRCALTAEECADESLVAPILTYPHDDRSVTGLCNSVTGGYFYRGPAATTLDGSYLFADFCTGTFWGARRNSAGRWVANHLLDTKLLPATFGEDQDGRLYVADFKPSVRGEDGSETEVGAVYRIIGQYSFSSDFETGDTSAWSSRRGNLTVTSPGLSRSANALEVPLSGGAKKVFVRARYPRPQTTFTVTFDFNANRAGLANQVVELLRLAGNKQKGHVKLTLEQDGEVYWLNLLARRADGDLDFLGRTRAPASRTVEITVTWMRASGADHADGEVSLSKKGKVRVQATNLANAKRDIRAVSLGLVSGSVPAGSGSFLIDNVRSAP